MARERVRELYYQGLIPQLSSLVVDGRYFRVNLRLYINANGYHTATEHLADIDGDFVLPGGVSFDVRERVTAHALAELLSVIVRFFSELIMNGARPYVRADVIVRLVVLVDPFAATPGDYVDEELLNRRVVHLDAGPPRRATSTEYPQMHYVKDDGSDLWFRVTE